MVKKHAFAQFTVGSLTALALVAVFIWTVNPVRASLSEPHGLSAPSSPAAFDDQSPLVIPAAAFRPDGNTTTHYLFALTGGYLYGTDVANKACLMAPVYIPVGAAIDRVMASVVDNGATPNWSMEFRRMNVLNGATVLLATLSTASVGASMQVRGAQLTANNLVPSEYYVYYLGTCVSTNQRLYGARVYYNINQINVPLITR